LPRLPLRLSPNLPIRHSLSSLHLRPVPLYRPPTPATSMSLPLQPLPDHPSPLRPCRGPILRIPTQTKRYPRSAPHLLPCRQHPQFHPVEPEESGGGVLRQGEIPGLGVLCGLLGGEE
jgi:hypothetical protein